MPSRRAEDLARSRTLPVIVAGVVVLSAITLGTAAIVVIAQPERSMTLIPLMFAFVGPTIVGLLAYVKGAENSVKLDSLHASLANGGIQESVIEGARIAAREAINEAVGAQRSAEAAMKRPTRKPGA